MSQGGYQRVCKLGISGAACGRGASGCRKRGRHRQTLPTGPLHPYWRGRLPNQPLARRGLAALPSLDGANDDRQLFQQDHFRHAFGCWDVREELASLGDQHLSLVSVSLLPLLLLLLALGEHRLLLRPI
jgi:hypothetical protein